MPPRDFSSGRNPCGGNNNFNNSLGSQAKPGTKPEAMTDAEGDNYNEANGSNASRIILATKIITDRTPGWIEKVLRKVFKFLP